MEAGAVLPWMLASGKLFGVDDRAGRERRVNVNMGVHACGDGLTLKGLRHTVATTLREAGLDERRIADLLGQKTLSMARHYSRSANLAAKNRETMATLETENARRARIVKPSAKSVKPKPKEKSE